MRKAPLWGLVNPASFSIQVSHCRTVRRYTHPGRTIYATEYGVMKTAYDNQAIAAKPIPTRHNLTVVGVVTAQNYATTPENNTPVM